MHRFDWARASALANTILKRVVRERMDIERHIAQDEFEVDLGRQEHKQEVKRSTSKAYAIVRTVTGAIPRVLLGATISGTVTYLLFVIFSAVLTKGPSALPSSFGRHSGGL